MQHRLNIAFGENPIWEIQAETSLGPSPQLSTPEIIGKSLGLNAEELSKLQTIQTKVEVGFEGHPYRVESLDQDGAYRLRLVHR